MFNWLFKYFFKLFKTTHKYLKTSRILLKCLVLFFSNTLICAPLNYAVITQPTSLLYYGHSRSRKCSLISADGGIIFQISLSFKSVNDQFTVPSNTYNSCFTTLLKPACTTA